MSMECYHGQFGNSKRVRLSTLAYPREAIMKKVKRMTRRAIIRSLQLLGYDFDKISLEGALERCRSRNPHIQTVIDIGASNGMWTEKCVKFYPEAYYFLIEAQKPHEKGLLQLKKKMPRMDYILAAAGDRNGEIYFDNSELFGGLASHVRLEGNYITVPVTTIDTQVQQHKLKAPFLLKLDTHGFEVPIFEGAKETLAQTELLVVETYNFTVAPGAKRFHEMCAFLEAKGFRCVDICDPLHRKRDRALWQFDLFFSPASDAVFESDEYY